MKKLDDNRGFTGINLEWTIVVAVVCILAAIIVPKVAVLIQLSDEGTAKKNLGTIRVALTKYHGDMGKSYPPNLAVLMVAGAGGKAYLNEIPRVKVPDYHADSAVVKLIDAVSELDDSGGWVYVSERKSPDWGTVLINCTHTDLKAQVWGSF